MRRIIIILNIVVIALVNSSCGEKTTITREYIYNTGWPNGEYQGFRISKIKLLDSTMSIDNPSFNRFKLADYVIDSSFCFEEVSLQGPKRSKVYFGETNETSRWSGCWDATNVRQEIGQLEFNTWYLIWGLRGTTDYYVYIDEQGESHVYSLGPTNW